MKRFYNNTLVCGAFSKALRLIALLCVLMGVSSSVWGAVNLVIWKGGSNSSTHEFKDGKCNVTINDSGDYYFYIDDNGSHKKLSGYSQMTSVWCTKWVFDGSNSDCGLKVENNQKGEFTFIIDYWNNGVPTVSVKYPNGGGDTPSGGTYYAKYNWDGGNWSWKQFDANNQITGTYRNSCMNVDTYENDGSTCYSINVIGDLSQGDPCTFTWDPTNNTVTAKPPVDPSQETVKLKLTRQVKYSESDNSATLYGYLTNNPETSGDCAILVEYGFIYTEVNTENQVCNAPEPTVDNAKFLILGKSDAALNRGTEFIGTLNNTGSDKSYGYRAYAHKDGQYYISEDWRCFTTKVCTNDLPAAPAPIEVYVDGISTKDSAYYDNCELRYGNLQRALNEIKKNPKITSANGNLLRPVTIIVSQFDSLATDGTLPDKGAGAGTYRGVRRDVSGGDTGSGRNLYVNVIKGFNIEKGAPNYNKNNTLTIKANNGDTPRIQHLLIRSSRNIILDGINMISDPKCKELDTALEIDNGFYAGDWGGQTGDEDRLKNANIVIKNCRVGSNGFTGVHINNINNITFENNTLNLKVEDFSKNAKEYGASAKFFACDKIKFIRNNFWGGHATLLWLQQVTNSLFYNNVFWNTNEYNENGCVAVRVYNQYNQNTDKVAVLYNTFYLADDGKTIANKKKYDFLKFGMDAETVIQGQDQDFPSGKNFYFMYNNCYSYDTDMSGKNTNFSKYKSKADNLCPNNFWSLYDENLATRPEYSGFDFQMGSCDKKFVNIQNLVCESTATGPKDLVIRNPKEGENGLKVGTQLTVDQIQTMSGITLTNDANELFSDRYKAGIRSNEDDGKWTLGALESTDANTVHVIYWTGDQNSLWDLRSNWAYREGEVAVTKSNQGARAADQRTLTCVDILAEDLKIVIPENGTANYPRPTSGQFYYPEIPANFDAEARRVATKVYQTNGIPAGEQVSAGVGVLNALITKYATTIELEYGAAIKGVENLKKNDTNYYDAAITNMTINRRDEYVLVGPVVWPFKNDESGDTRTIVSNDYYLDKEPNVWMRQTTIEAEGDAFTTNWGEPFASLEEPVGEHTAYAVNIPDSYGDAKKRAISYYWGKNDALLNDGTAPKSFNPLKGRFVNESALPVYNFNNTGAHLLNNSYPANISVKALQGSNNENGTVYLYNYSSHSFDLADISKADAYIKPQHAFVFIPKKTGELTVDKSMFVGGDTKSRSAVAETPVVAVSLYAGHTKSDYYSTVYVRQTENDMDGIVESPLNAPKVFAGSSASTPELYLLANDDRFTRLCIGSKEQTFPLGIRLQKAMYVVFAKQFNKNFSKVMLFDAETGKEYNLLEKSHTVDILPVGETEGRFFLNVAVASNNDYVEDDDVTTAIEEESANKAINLYTDSYNRNAIRVITTNVELQSVLVSDLMGRTIQYMVSGNSAYIQMPDNKSIYVIQVIGDGLTRTEKVIVK